MHDGDLEWVYDERDWTWKCGTQTLGAGVFLDAPLAGDEEEWYGNVSTPLRILMIGPFATKEAAQACAEQRLREYNTDA